MEVHRPFELSYSFKLKTDFHRLVISKQMIFLHVNDLPDLTEITEAFIIFQWAIEAVSSVQVF